MAIYDANQRGRAPAGWEQLDGGSLPVKNTSSSANGMSTEAAMYEALQGKILESLLKPRLQFVVVQTPYFIPVYAGQWPAAELEAPCDGDARAAAKAGDFNVKFDELHAKLIDEMAEMKGFLEEVTRDFDQKLAGCPAQAAVDDLQGRVTNLCEVVKQSDLECKFDALKRDVLQVQLALDHQRIELLGKFDEIEKEGKEQYVCSSEQVQGAVTEPVVRGAVLEVLTENASADLPGARCDLGVREDGPCGAVLVSPLPSAFAQPGLATLSRPTIATPRHSFKSFVGSGQCQRYAGSAKRMAAGERWRFSFLQRSLWRSLCSY